MPLQQPSADTASVLAVAPLGLEEDGDGAEEELPHVPNAD